jgi:hypothetical protein
LRDQGRVLLRSSVAIDLGVAGVLPFGVPYALDDAAGGGGRSPSRVMIAGSPHPKRCGSMVRLGGVGGFFASPCVQVRECFPVRDFELFAKLSCQSSINRRFTPTYSDAAGSDFTCREVSVSG